MWIAGNWIIQITKNIRNDPIKWCNIPATLITSILAAFCDLPDPICLLRNNRALPIAPDNKDSVEIKDIFYEHTIVFEH